MTSSGHVTFDSPWELSYGLPIGSSHLSPLASEAYIHTDTDIQTDID